MVLCYEAVEIAVVGLHLEPPLPLADLVVGVTLVTLGLHAWSRDRHPVEA